MIFSAICAIITTWGESAKLSLEIEFIRSPLEFLQGRDALRAYFNNVTIYSAVGAGYGDTVKKRFCLQEGLGQALVGDKTSV